MCTTLFLINYCVHNISFKSVAMLQYMDYTVSLFSFSLDMWLRPTIAGTQPPPCSDMSLTKVDSYRAVMFGGYGEDYELISPDVYILDMLHWVS